MNCCTNCVYVCDPSSSIAITDDLKRRNHVWRTPASIRTMKTTVRTVNAYRPVFDNSSDRRTRSLNPITKKRGVDLKHNSYARFLARKKGKTICCCVCTQTLTNQDTGLDGLLNVGDKIKQITTGVTGEIISIEYGLGIAEDETKYIIRLDGCPPLINPADNIQLYSIHNNPAPPYTWANFTVISTNTCPENEWNTRTKMTKNWLPI